MYAMSCISCWSSARAGRNGMRWDEVPDAFQFVVRWPAVPVSGRLRQERGNPGLTATQCWFKTAIALGMVAVGRIAD